ncbi:uncharacterized protein K444DRAFT_617806, partial [Hyaloscypha bicolor E]
LGMRSDKETAAEAATPHDASAPSRMHPATVRPRIKRLRWTDEEDATVLKMKDEDGCSWEEISSPTGPQRRSSSTTMRSERVLMKPMSWMASSRRDGEAGPGSKL